MKLNSYGKVLHDELDGCLSLCVNILDTIGCRDLTDPVSVL